MPSNVNTDETTIINKILAALRSIAGFGEANAFLCAIPLFLEDPPSDVYLELVPGAAMEKAAKQGTGWVEDSFTVCVFKRLFRDQDGRDTARIADASAGLLKTVAAVDAKLTANYLSGLALVPILPERRDAGERNPQDPADGWIMVKRSFKVEYLYAFPSPQSTS